MPDPSKTFFQQLTTPRGLAAGWRRVERKNSAPGVDRVTVNAFRERLHENMETLRRELARHTYRTRPLRRLQLAKPDGTVRLLGIPTVRDRIVQSAVHQLLTPKAERVLKNCSYGYRPGRSHHQAIRQVSLERERGLRWVVDGDIEAFFDHVCHARLLRQFQGLVPGEEMAALVAQWIAAPVRERGAQTRRDRGLPQGAVLSPLLSNLYLDVFDDALLGRGFRLVRFADDFLVLCPSRRQAEAALSAAGHALRALHLRLNASKTSITSFEQGFRFLGARFEGNRVHSDTVSSQEKPFRPQSTPAPVHVNPKPKKSHRPSPSTQARSDSNTHPSDSEPAVSTRSPSTPSHPTASTRPESSPFLRTLYVQEQGASLRVSGGRILLTAPGDAKNVLLAVPITKIAQIVIFGACHLSPAALRRCLRRQVPVTLLSSRGRYYGRIESTEAGSIELLRLQFTKSSDLDFNLKLAKRLVQGKIATLLCRNRHEG